MIAYTIREFFKELKNIFVDFGAALILVIAPLSYSFVYSIPYATEVIKDVPIGVCDNDASDTSRRLVRMIEASPYLEIVSYPTDLESAKKEMNKQKIYAYIDIPQGFSSDIKKEKKTFVSVYTDSGYLIVYRQIMANMNLIVGTVSKQIEVKNVLKQVGDFGKALEISMPVKISETPLFNPSGGYESYIFPAVLILILQQTMLVGVGLLCGTARELGEFKHYSQSCIPSIVLGKSFAHVVTYLCHCITYFVIIPELYRFSFYYNFWLIFFILLPYLFGVSFLAQTLTILFKKRESSLLAIVVISLPLAFLPGIIWPKEAIPSLLRGLSMTLPCTGAMDSIVKVNQMGATFGDVKYSFILLVVLMIVYYFTAVKVYRRLAKTEN